MDDLMEQPKKDTRCRKWMVTINNPVDKGFDHDRIRTTLAGIKNLDYWCLCDEVGGKTGTHHTHIVLYRSTALRFSALQKIFPPGSQLDNLRGTVQQARDYVRKEGKYAGTEKEETNLKETFEESGEVPEERQGQRTDLTVLYDLIKDGNSNYEILEHNPGYMSRLETIDKVRETLRFEEFRSKRRLELEVCYWYGEPGTGKTSGVLDLYGDANVYIISDYRHPWDGYMGQDIVLFDDFDSGYVLINDLLRWLDVYPLALPCRYNNKVACYTKVYFTSNKPFDQLYKCIQTEDHSVWNAFCRRFHKFREYTQSGYKEFVSFNAYMDFVLGRRKHDFVTVSKEQYDQISMMFPVEKKT